MSIQSITTEFAGQVGVLPRNVRIATTDTLATATTVNYLQNTQRMGTAFYPTDIVFLTCTDGYGIFSPLISGQNITLVSINNPANTGSINNQIVIFNNNAGVIGPSGVAISSIAQVSGPTVNGNVAKFSNTTGQLTDSGFAATNIQSKSNILAGILNYAGGGTVATFTINGLLTSSVITPTLSSSLNGRAIVAYAITGANTLQVTFNLDPGTTIIHYSAFIAPQ
jgi:hypothetical protein